jgi:ATP-dependent exoDNAse (exonuclease V) beta subunit
MRNERLIANAGSGKTHALTTRVIQLLARGVNPGKIAALTFTRKSAGEFLSAVFARLAGAALDPEKLATLRAAPHLGTLDADACSAILEKLALQPGRLGMGTIDSFFARIAHAFPLESGLAEDFRVAGDAELDSARERTLAELFSRESTASLDDFVELLRRIHRNHGERDVFTRLLRETQNLHAKFLATPPSVVWGNAASIWGTSGCAILAAGKVSPAADAFMDAVLETHEDFSNEAVGVLAANLELLKTLDTGARWNLAIANFLKSRLCAEPKSGALRITAKKTGWLELNTRVRASRLELLRAALKPEFESLLARSRSLHAFMGKFEEAYSSLVRSAGAVTFADIMDSLARRAGDPLGGESWRASAAYRIDQTFEHWLLDEFQDTSRPQWMVLNTFIEEVLMDPTGNRSFFYVGDTKQAIYSWRGGDPDLFFEIFDEVNKIQPTIHDAPPLAQSWRSCPAILDFVNQAFGDLSPTKDILGIPDATADKWAKAWTEHTASPKTCKVNGYAAWVRVPETEGDADDESSALDRQILEILNQTQAWRRGLSCAVLKPDNKGIAALAALLRSNGIPLAVEGTSNPCVDNPLGAALLAALRVAASPDDSLSLAVASGFPAASTWRLGDLWKFRRQTLSTLAQHGYAATIHAWIQSCAGAESFLLERAEAFLLAAEEFDSTRRSSDGIPEFLHFIESRQTRGNEAAGVVRLMTVHQSKGLGFDMVIAAGLDKKSRANDGTQIALGPDSKRVQWGVLLPAKDFADQDAVLRRQVEIQEAENKYGSLCKWYVALTRAKKALYVATTELADGSDSKNFARFLTIQLKDSPTTYGDAGWFQGHPEIASPAGDCTLQPEFHAPLCGTPKPISPSSAKTSVETTSPQTGYALDAAEFGTAVHAALARIEWLDEENSIPGDVSAEAESLLRNFLASHAARATFTRPNSPATLWREQAFDVQLDGQWVSGVFDRVVAQLNKDGSPASAKVYDFKTDHGTDSEINERYSGQMEIYRQAAAKLFGLSLNSVDCQIVRVR